MENINNVMKKIIFLTKRQANDICGSELNDYFTEEVNNIDFSFIITLKSLENIKFNNLILDAIKTPENHDKKNVLQYFRENKSNLNLKLLLIYLLKIKSYSTIAKLRSNLLNKKELNYFIYVFDNLNKKII
jgi:hypothetical protein